MLRVNSRDTKCVKALHMNIGEVGIILGTSDGNSYNGTPVLRVMEALIDLRRNNEWRSNLDNIMVQLLGKGESIELFNEE
jgi:hypothetical protein